MDISSQVVSISRSARLRGFALARVAAALRFSSTYLRVRGLDSASPDFLFVLILGHIFLFFFTCLVIFLNCNPNIKNDTRWRLYFRFVAACRIHFRRW